MKNFRLIAGIDICEQLIAGKRELGQTHCEEWFKRIHTKISL
jgi:hypothetical protein